MERRDPNIRRDMQHTPAEIYDGIDRICECAVRLVHLGANCQVKLQIPAQRRNAPLIPNDPGSTYRALNFGGKTAQELAGLARRQESIRAIELMRKTENVHLTQCRCGCRLPWNQCHGAYIEHDNGRLCWRYSPKAMCPCKLKNKEHYKCCWFTSTPLYKDDSYGGIPKVIKSPFDRTTKQTLRRLEQMRVPEVMIIIIAIYFLATKL
jgi:hypothetical protein